jgi:transposase
MGRQIAFALHRAKILHDITGQAVPTVIQKAWFFAKKGSANGCQRRSRENGTGKKKLQQIARSGEYEIYFEDECHFKLTLTLIRAWFLSGSAPRIKSPVDRFKYSIYGAMGCNGQLVIHSEEKFDADSFRRFLEVLLAKTCGQKKILLVLDNARYHHAKQLAGYIEEIKDRLELYFLPPYSPEINDIEMLWRKTRRNVTHNRYFEKLGDMKKELCEYWERFSAPNAELARLCAFINVV